MNQNRSIWSLDIRLWWFIAVSLAWIFLVRDSELFSTLTSLPKNALLAAIIALFSWFYRDLKFTCVIRKDHLAWFVGVATLLSLINGHVLLQALTCDELYHLGMASQSVIAVEKLIRAGGAFGAYLRMRPMTELVPLLNIAVLCVAVLICWLSLKLVRLGKTEMSQSRIRFVLLFLILIAVGQLFRLFPHRVEIHPPLRLLPLFFGQFFFGYDDFVFRMASTLTLGLLMTLGVGYVKTKSDVVSESSHRRVFIGLAAFAIPTLLHISSIVEPSIWAYATWLGVFFLLSRYFAQRDERYLITAGIVIALGALMRQNAMVLWSVLGIVLLWQRPKASTWFKCLLPCLWFLPFFSHLVFGDHPAKSDHPIGNVIAATLSGKSLFFIVSQTTPPWILVASILAIFAVFHKLWKNEAAIITCLALVPAFILYFSINPFLWPLGRYQAEWIAPAITILGLMVAACVERRHLPFLTGVFAVVTFYSVYVVRELHRDSYYDVWSERRITSESIYPYREAFGHLEQADEGGRFTFTFGVPVYGEWLLYARGYSYNDVELYRSLQSQWQEIGEASHTWFELVSKARAAGIRYHVIQYGNKREMQHRASWQNQVESLLRTAAATPNSGVTRLYTYSGELEGKIDVYEF